MKVGARGREFRAVTEQVLNHVMPALADIKPKVTVKAQHHEDRGPFTLS